MTSPMITIPVPITHKHIGTVCPCCKRGIIEAKTVGGVTAECNGCNQRFVVREENA